MDYDDASEWDGMDEYLESLGDEPITLESLVLWLEENDPDDQLREVPVAELLARMREARS